MTPAISLCRWCFQALLVALLLTACDQADMSAQLPDMQNDLRVVSENIAEKSIAPMRVFSKAQASYVELSYRPEVIGTFVGLVKSAASSLEYRVTDRHAEATPVVLTMCSMKNKYRRLEVMQSPDGVVSIGIYAARPPLFGATPCNG